MFTYYNTEDNFKSEFYNIYSSTLTYKDVLLEYSLLNADDEKYSTNVKDADLVHGYAIKNGKVYIDSCTIGGSDYERMDKFVVESKTDDTIKVNYKLIYKDQLAGGNEYEGGNGQVVLTKENGDWKILSATIVGMCNSTYKIGK